jgi:carbamate kinase
MTIVAVGGNAILRKGERGTVEEQIAHAVEAMAHLALLAAEGSPLLLTHGNGPTVGNLLLRSEAARGVLPPVPLYLCDAESQGEIGFLLQTALANVFRRRGISRQVVTLLTHVVVDPGDPAFSAPTKPIGPFYTAEEAGRFRMERGWILREDAHRGWRRVVPSPAPLRIMEAEAIGRLAGEGIIVICAGGGGIPVTEREDGTLEGVDAVVDKDSASALLGKQIGAERLIILTTVDRVCLHYDTPEQRPIAAMSAAEAGRWMEEGHFAPGSMRPKIRAAVEFLAAGGKEVLIGLPEELEAILAGRAGTRVVP